MLITLKELCTQLNISRRSIQCYEKEGLLKPTDRNKYGYLLYDEALKARVEKIRFLNKIGFKLCEIGTFIDKPKHIIIETLNSKIKELENNREELRIYVNETQAYIRLLEQEDA